MRPLVKNSMVDKDFRLDLFSLKNGNHQIEYQIGDKFFEDFDDSPVEKGNITVVAKIEKNSRLVHIDFFIEGDVELQCDRSMELFMHALKTHNLHIFKYAEAEEDVNEDITHITQNTQFIHLGHLIYEFVVLSIPMRKIHPDYQDQEDEEETFFFQTEPDEEHPEKEEKKVDPRWEALKKLNKK